ncbi:MAG: DNA repair exonuclease [Alphaproteobacteria bacterium]
MTFRFVHTADVHLDSPLKSLALRDADLPKAVDAATRVAFGRIVDLCLAEQVDALLIAGDLYDGANASMKTAAFLAAELRRLPPEIHVFILKGNHDARSGITARLDLPDHVKTFDGRGQVHEFTSRTGAAVAIHGVSFSDPHAPESLLPKYKPPIEGAINVGLLQTSLDGAPGPDPYSPVAAADLAAHGFAYWALGHIHRRSVVQAGGACIVMPGIPQGRHVNEAGPKSVTLAAVAQDGAVRLEERRVAAVEFARLDLALDPDDADMEAALAAAERALDRASTESDAEALILRLAVTPPAAFEWRLRREEELVAERVRVAARQRGFWIEQVEIRAAARADAAAGWADLAEALRDVLDDPGFRLARKEIADDFVRFLKSDTDLVNLLGEDAEAEASIHDGLAAEGVTEAIARLAATNAPGDQG